jgi:hypothetical protein
MLFPDKRTRCIKEIKSNKNTKAMLPILTLILQPLKKHPKLMAFLIALSLILAHLFLMDKEIDIQVGVKVHRSATMPPSIHPTQGTAIEGLEDIRQSPRGITRASIQNRAAQEGEVCEEGRAP